MNKKALGFFKFILFVLVYGALLGSGVASLPVGWPENKVLILPDMGSRFIVSAVKSAHKSIDLALYHLDDPEVIDELIKASQKGVKVRVLLNKPDLYPSPFETKINKGTSEKLSKHGIEIHFLEDYKYALTHFKFMIIDMEFALVQTFNYDDLNFNKARNFGLTLEDKSQVAALSRIFENDFTQKSAKNDKETLRLWKENGLILGPVNQRKLMTNLLRSAKSSIYIYQQDISDPEIGQLLASLAKKGKKIKILMVPAPFGGLDNNRLNQTIITASGGEYRYRPNNPKSELYIHAKVVLIDPEQGGQLYVGSCNFWPEALSRSRELGVVTRDKAQVRAVFDVFKKDWQSALSYDEANALSGKK